MQGGLWWESVKSQQRKKATLNHLSMPPSYTISSIGVYLFLNILLLNSTLSTDNLFELSLLRFIPSTRSVLPMTFGIVLYTQSHFNGLVLTQFVYEVCHVFHFQTNETNVVIVAGGPYLLF